MKLNLRRRSHLRRGEEKGRRGEEGGEEGETTGEKREEREGETTGGEEGREETVRGGWGAGIYSEIPTELPMALKCCRCD